MVGRGEELRLVQATVTAARAGRSDVLVIRGEAGTGKTALLQHALAISEGIEVHATRAVESEHALSLALLSRSCRRYCGGTGGRSNRPNGGSSMLYEGRTTSAAPMSSNSAGKRWGY